MRKGISVNQRTDVLTAMKTSRMTAFQTRTVVLCMSALLIVGYDLSVIALALPYIPDGFFTDDFQRGIVLSAALLGMALGCFFIAPIADRIGRRKLIVTLLFIGALSMLGCALAADASTLMLFRLITGIAAGGMQACLFILVQEQSSEQRRVIVFGVFTMGFPLGALLAAAAAVFLLPLPGFGWQTLFLLGGAATLLVALWSLFALPESVEYLLTRERVRPDTAPRVQKAVDGIVRRLKNPLIDPQARPAFTPSAEQDAAGLSALFTGGMYRATLLLWLALIGPALAYFFVSTWTPQLVSAALNDPAAGTSIGLYLGFGMVLGSVAIAIMAVRLSAFIFTWVAAVLAAAGVLALSVSFSSPAAAGVVTILVGGFAGIAQAGANSLVPALYPVSVRTTASGWLQGLGFVAGFAAPLLAGALLAIASPDTLFALASLPLLLGAASGLALWLVRGRRRSVEPVDSESEALLAGHVAPPAVLPVMQDTATDS